MEYEDLRSGAVTVIESASLSGLPDALIKAPYRPGLDAG
jgi:hypothetical protein